MIRTRYWFWGGVLFTLMGFAGYIVLENCISSFSTLTTLPCGPSVLGLPFIFISVSMSPLWDAVFGSSPSYISIVKIADFVIALLIFTGAGAFLGLIYGKIKYRNDTSNDLIVIPSDVVRNKK